MSWIPFSSHKELIMMVVKRPLLCSSISIDLCFTKRESLISGIICWSLICMGWWRDIGLNKDTLGPVAMNLMFKISKEKYIWLMMRYKSIHQTMDDSNLQIRYLIMSFKNIWIRLIPKRIIHFLIWFYLGWKKFV